MLIHLAQSSLIRVSDWDCCFAQFYLSKTSRGIICVCVQEGVITWMVKVLSVKFSCLHLREKGGGGTGMSW